MTFALRFADSVPIALGAGSPEKRLRWIHCANEGEYRGHSQGEFRLTRDVFDEIVRNFRGDPRYKTGEVAFSAGEGEAPVKATVGVQPVLQFDYEHASEMPPSEGTIPATGAPACAWALDLEVREASDGRSQLWALARLGAQIQGQIEREEYRFVSVAFVPDAVHWQTAAPLGYALTSIAFTNHPFLRDLEPLAASARASIARDPQRAVPSPASEAPGDPHRGDADAMTEDEKKKLAAYEATLNTISKRLNVNLFQEGAVEAAVGAAVDAGAASGGQLKSILEALGKSTAAEALGAIPELMAAREEIAGALSEIDGIIGQQQAADAPMQEADVAAVMTSKGWGADGAIKKALSSFWLDCFRSETAAPGAAAGPLVTKVRALRGHVEAREKGRAKFLTEYGVDPARAASAGPQHLQRTLVAGPQGQVEPPRVLPLAAGHQQATMLGDLHLDTLSGRNTTEKLITHLSAKDPNFSKLPWGDQVRHASQLRSRLEAESGAH